MKHLTILVPDGNCNLSSIIGSYKILTRANDFWKGLGRKPVFQIQLAGLSKKIKLYDGLFSVTPNLSVKSLKKTDFILIPSLNHDYEKIVKQNLAMVDFIRKQYKEGSEVASICTGAFLLASTGLLDGKNCSTHWIAIDKFRKLYPAVKAVPEKIITDEHGLYTNGGAFSFLNLILYLIEKYYDRQTAIFCSKVFQIEIDRQNQSIFTILPAKRNTMTTL
jgi:transcriptional regulator GlxA family with amidase domain